MALQAPESQFSPPWLMPVQGEIISGPFCNRWSHPATVPTPRWGESDGERAWLQEAGAVNGFCELPGWG